MKNVSCTEKAMKISAKARYALRIVLDVAAHSADGALRRGAEIADAQNISEKFLSRIVIPLREKYNTGATWGGTLRRMLFLASFALFYEITVF